MIPNCAHSRLNFPHFDLSRMRVEVTQLGTSIHAGSGTTWIVPSRDSLYRDSQYTIYI